MRAKYHDIDAATYVYVVLGEGQPVYDIRQPLPDRAQAEAAARGRLARLARATGRISLDLPGDPTARAGGPLTTRGWGGGEDGEWTMTRVVHTLTPTGGYRTSIEGEAYIATE